jgi:hypothetical protein
VSAKTSPGLLFFARQDMPASNRKIKPSWNIGTLAGGIDAVAFHISTKCQSPPDPLGYDDYELSFLISISQGRRVGVTPCTIGNLWTGSVV